MGPTATPSRDASLAHSSRPIPTAFRPPRPAELRSGRFAPPVQNECRSPTSIRRSEARWMIAALPLNKTLLHNTTGSITHRHEPPTVTYLHRKPAIYSLVPLA